MHVRRVSAADLPDFADISAKSMWNDEVIVYTAPYRDQFPESLVRHFLLRAKKRFYSGQWLFIAVTDEDDPEWDGKERVIGYSCFSTSMQDVEKPSPGGRFWDWFEFSFLRLQEYHSWLFHLDRSVDQKRETHFRQAVATDPSFDDIPDFWELELLGVHPDFQRRGIGKKLMQWGFDNAKASGVPLLVVASLQGEKLYLKLGFKEINRVDMGSEAGFSWAAMRWDSDKIADTSVPT